MSVLLKIMHTINYVFSICLRMPLNTTTGLDLIAAPMEIINDHAYNHVYDDKTSNQKKREKIQECPRVMILDWLEKV